MTPGAVQVVANGFSTDHPIPGLAFVDDTHIPVQDPDAIEAIGRGAGPGRHGRCDKGFEFIGPTKQRQWWAATTEPDGTDLAWAVRYHPNHGRSVVLIRNRDLSTLHHDWEDDGGPLLFRAGGYWWDGEVWYRPLQIFDFAAERYVRRSVAGAVTVSAAHRLANSDGGETRATVLTITDVRKAARDGAIQPMAVDDWDSHLWLWSTRRSATALPLTQCVVDIGAAELLVGQLIGTPELAALAGIAPATLRAYVARGEAELPVHQAVITGRNLWSRRVGAEWVESRNRTPDKIAAALAATPELSVGQADLQERFASRFLDRMWSAPFRKQWRLRNEETARQRANELAFVVADNLDDIVPAEALRSTVHQAVLAQFAKTQAFTSSHASIGHAEVRMERHTALMLDWLVRHDPSNAASLINDIIGDARRELELPASAGIEAIDYALRHDGKLSESEYDAFLGRALPPAEHPGA